MYIIIKKHDNIIKKAINNPTTTPSIGRQLEYKRFKSQD